MRDDSNTSMEKTAPENAPTAAPLMNPLSVSCPIKAPVMAPNNIPTAKNTQNAKWRDISSVDSVSSH